MGIVVSETQLITTIHTQVKQRFAEIDDIAHGWEHIERVYKLALHIAAREGADPFIVGAAALMHDLGRIHKEQSDSPGHHHADYSVVLAAEILTDLQVVSSTQQQILHAIVAHSFSRKIEPQTLEACVVRDADRLDGIGAIGVLRWAITGAMRRNVQTRSYHPSDPFANDHELDDKRYMIDHFYTKLLKVGDTMSTETGRKMAERRIAFLHTYLEEFKHELLF